MLARNTVYLTEDRSRAVAEGDPKARYLLVRAGQEISQAQAEKVEGAITLVAGNKPAEKSETIHTREPVLENRDPKPDVPHGTNSPPTGIRATGGKR